MVVVVVVVVDGGKGEGGWVRVRVAMSASVHDEGEGEGVSIYLSIYISIYILVDICIYIYGVLHHVRHLQVHTADVGSETLKRVDDLRVAVVHATTSEVEVVRIKLDLDLAPPLDQHTMRIVSRLANRSVRLAHVVEHTVHLLCLEPLLVVHDPAKHKRRTGGRVRGRERTRGLVSFGLVNTMVARVAPS